MSFLTKSVSAAGPGRLRFCAEENTPMEVNCMRTTKEDLNEPGSTVILIIGYVKKAKVIQHERRAILSGAMTEAACPHPGAKR